MVISGIHKAALSLWKLQKVMEVTFQIFSLLLISSLLVHFFLHNFSLIHVLLSLTLKFLL